MARATLCLSCHLGTADKFTTHRIMGAGHPRLRFSLDSFSNFKPHFIVDADYKQRKVVVDGVTLWVVGLAVSAEQRLAMISQSSPQAASQDLLSIFSFLSVTKVVFDQE